MDGKERRRHKRIKCSCTVRVRQFREGMDTDIPGRWEVVTLEDLSQSGMLFSHSRSFSANTMLEINISITPNAAPVYCIGRVIRSVKKPSIATDAAQPSVYMTAVLFKSLDGGTLETIKRICEVAEQKNQ